MHHVTHTTSTATTSWMPWGGGGFNTWQQPSGDFMRGMQMGFMFRTMMNNPMMASLFNAMSSSFGNAGDGCCGPNGGTSPGGFGAANANPGSAIGLTNAAGAGTALGPTNAAGAGTALGPATGNPTFGPGGFSPTGYNPGYAGGGCGPWGCPPGGYNPWSGYSPNLGMNGPSNQHQTIRDSRGDTHQEVSGHNNNISYTGDRGANTFRVGGFNNTVSISNVGRDETVQLEGPPSDWQILPDNDSEDGVVTYYNARTNNKVTVATDDGRDDAFVRDKVEFTGSDVFMQPYPGGFEGGMPTFFQQPNPNDFNNMVRMMNFWSGMMAGWNTAGDQFGGYGGQYV